MPQLEVSHHEPNVEQNIEQSRCVVEEVAAPSKKEMRICSFDSCDLSFSFRHIHETRVVELMEQQICLSFDSLNKLHSRECLDFRVMEQLRGKKWEHPLVLDSCLVSCYLRIPECYFFSVGLSQQLEHVALLVHDLVEFKLKVSLSWVS